jgi:hypothetical protein
MVMISSRLRSLNFHERPLDKFLNLRSKSTVLILDDLKEGQVDVSEVQILKHQCLRERAIRDG